MNEDELGQLAEAVAEESGVELPEENKNTEEPVVTEPVAEGAEAPADTEEDVAEDAPEPKETEKVEPEVEAPTFDWDAFKPDVTNIPPMPTPDENGTVDLEAFERRTIEAAKAELRAENAFNQELTRQVSQAEEILPQMKTNPRVAELVKNQAMVAAQEGKPLDIVGAAKVIADEFNVVRAEAATNANVSVEIQDNAVVGGGTNAPSQADADRRAIEQRVNSGDENAILEVLDDWSKSGVI